MVVKIKLVSSMWNVILGCCVVVVAICTWWVGIVGLLWCGLSVVVLSGVVGYVYLCLTTEHP